MNHKLPEKANVLHRINTLKDKINEGIRTGECMGETIFIGGDLPEIFDYLINTIEYQQREIEALKKEIQK